MDNNDEDQAIVPSSTPEASSMATAVPPAGPEGYIDWTASEFIAHDKSPIWYLALAVLTIGLATVVYVFTHDIITTIVIVVVGALLGTTAAHKPKEQHFKLDNNGLTIGNKSYPYENYRSFTVMDEGAFSVLTLLPINRFGLMAAAYYDPADERKIIDVIGNHLPIEEKSKDILDRMLWRIRF